MADKLLIIESPNKIKTLSKYLGSDYEIIATIGHVRDLAKFGMGFDTKTFEPKWVIPNNDKKKIVEQIKKASKNSKEIYIATDPDREGEAIAWHVFDILGKAEQKKCKRITFNEISKNAVQKSFENKRDINESWVKSQFARRIADRLIGFRLSQLVKNKLNAESAGRVQSVALKFIADREKEINDFIPIHWFNLDVTLSSKMNLTLIKLDQKFQNFQNYDEVKRTGFNFKDEQDAKTVLSSLDTDFVVKEISDKKILEVSPKEPYKTSTLQQDGINKLNFSSKKITSISQKLYEGIEIDGSQIALITYPRTDSTRLSNDFIAEAKKIIENQYGNDYIGNNKSFVAKTGVQDAHEAIRPVDPNLTPISLKAKLSSQDWKLYNLVWQRTMAYLMKNAIFEQVKITLNNAGNEFNVSSRQCIFKGYQVLWKDDLEEQEEFLINLKKFAIGTKHKAKKSEVVARQTSPPARFNQASLIKALEAAGVGRPSTYNSMANVALDRGYATLDSKAFVVTDIGNSLIEQLDIFFQDVINKNFTREMEEHLDKIALQEEVWDKWLKDFSPEFDEKIKNARLNMEKTPDEKVGRDCPTCHKELVYKVNRKYNSKFIGCSGYPDCKYLEAIDKPKPLDDLCPMCEKNLIIRQSKKKGSEFIACTGFPKCRYLISMDEYNKHKAQFPNEPLPKIELKKKAK